ncbi:MAG: hypothetical protein AB8B83_03060 [Bdellovibrionales bacterium]
MNAKKLGKLRKTLTAEFEKAHGKGSFTKLYMNFNNDDNVRDCNMNREAHSILLLFLLAYSLKKHQVLQGMLANKFLEKAEMPENYAKLKMTEIEPYQILEIARSYADDYLDDDPDKGYVPYDPETIPYLDSYEAA